AMRRPTLAALLVPAAWSVAAAGDKPGPVYAPVPKAANSFGACECEGFIYVYGGHAGKVHTYSNETTLGTFLRLPAGGGAKWEELPGGTHLQGLNLAAIEGKIYRVGGMEARNK